MICCNFYYMYQNLQNCICAQEHKKFTDDSNLKIRAEEQE